MKQNFFKYVLLGAFTLALGVGFVGCKDYDDDIDKIDVRLSALEGLKSDLSALESKIGNQISTSDATAAINAAKLAAIADAKAYADQIVSEIELPAGAEPYDDTKIKEDLSTLAARVTVLDEGLADALERIAGITAMDADVLAALLDLQQGAVQALKDNGFVDAEGEASWAAAIEAIADAQKLAETLGKLDASTLEKLDEQLEALAEGLSLLQSVALKSLIFTPQVYTDGGGRGIRFLTYYYVPMTYAASKGKLGAARGWEPDQWAVADPKEPPTTFDEWKAAYVFRTNTPTTVYDMNSRLISESTLATDKISFDYLEASTRTLTLDQITAEYVGLESGDLKVKIGVSGELIQHYGGFYAQYAYWKNNDADGGDRSTFYLPNLPEYNTVTGGVIDEDANADYGDNALYALDMVQLKVPMAEGGDIVSSDWAALYNMWLPEFVIAHKGKGKNSYYGTEATDGTKPESHYAYITDHVVAEAFSDSHEPVDYTWQPDTVLVYNTGKVDLKGVVRASGWAGDDPATTNIAYDGDYLIKNYEDIDIEELGFKWEFELLDYVIDNTNQKDFVTMTEDGVVTSKVFGEDDKRAGIGRTPLFRVKIVDPKNNNAVVKAAYVKMEIVGEPMGITIDLGTLPMACNEVRIMTVEEMNTLVYNALGITKKDFHDTYEFAAVDPEGDHVQPNPTSDVGFVNEIQFPDGSSTTYLLAWAPQYEDENDKAAYLEDWTAPTFVATDATNPYTSTYVIDEVGSHEDEAYWTIRKETKISNIVSYVPKSGSGTGITITLTATVKVPTLEIVQADTYAPFWSRTNANHKPVQGVASNTDFFMQNTAVPHNTSDDAWENNTFTNNIYAGFVTYPKLASAQADGQLWGANKWGKMKNVAVQDAGYEEASYETFKNFYDNLQVHYYFKAEENTRDFVVDGVTYKISVDDGTDKYATNRPGAWAAEVAKGKILYATLGETTQIIAQIAPVNTKASKEESATGYTGWQDQDAIMGNGVSQAIYYSLQYGSRYAAENGPDNGELVDFADIILNTDEFAAYIYSEGWMCGNSKHVFDITGDYADFWVRFVRPLTAENSGAYWYDARDGYSWIRATDVIKFMDWRKEKFSDAANAHLYGFYGVAWANLEPNFATAMIAQGRGTLTGGQTVQNANLAYAKKEDILTNGFTLDNGQTVAADAKALALDPQTDKYYRIDGTTKDRPVEDGEYFFGYRNLGQPVSAEWTIRFQAGMPYNWGILPMEIQIGLRPSLWAPGE